LIAKERLTVSKAFTSIALFSQLQEPMTALPGQFFAMLHGKLTYGVAQPLYLLSVAYVSMQRIEEFLSESEVPKWASSLTASHDNRRTGEIGFAAAAFQWPSLPKSSPTPSSFELGPLDIIFPKGKLTLVGGATGSGKSALLAALLGGQPCIVFFCLFS
jgi:ABC-type multidrug transport system fused ATPase/permease subunit